MEEDLPINLTFWDATLSLLSLLFFLADVVLDVLAVVNLYEEEKFLLMGLLVLLLLGSSSLIQIFSWLWYSDPNRNVETNFERFISRHRLLAPVHICQLGVFLRFAGVMENTIHSFPGRDSFQEGVTVYLNHDLSMLRLFESFSENAPQLVLMIAIMMDMQDLQLLKDVSVLASTVSVAWAVVDYHRSLRFFLPEKSNQTWRSSVVYFLWNLFLIGPRVACVSLFTSVMSCYVFAHFLLLWLVFVIWASLQDTNFMDSRAGEWLYRATVGLIWYFSWFNVVEGKTRDRSAIYHWFIMTDSAILTVTWWFYRDPGTSRSYSLILLILIPLSYLMGLVGKMLYYCCFHPKLGQNRDVFKKVEDVPDGPAARSFVLDAESKVLNKRMAKHAAVFYKTGTPDSTGVI